MSPDIEAIRAHQGHGSCSSGSARRRCYSAAPFGTKWDQLSRKEPLEQAMLCFAPVPCAERVAPRLT